MKKFRLLAKKFVLFMKRFWLNCFLATGTVFVIMWGLSELTNLNMFDAFDPIGQALNDFELTDYAFSQMRDTTVVDDRIVLVNIGNIPRGAIAEQIRIISQYKPKVIAVDCFFYCEGGLRDAANCPQLLDTLGNLMLAHSIEQAGNVVLVSKLYQSSKLMEAGIEDVYDSMAYSDPEFQHAAASGFANLPTGARYQDDVKISRSFFPKIEVNGKDEMAFSVKVAMAYDSAATMEFLSRNNEEELINFRGNFEMVDVRQSSLESKHLAATNFPSMFFALDVRQVLTEDFDPAVLKDKIVILGYLGDVFGDPAWEDKFFTPLNLKIAGRANPDMFGVVIHANIISMILNKDYIDELEEWHKYLIAFTLCYFNVALFFYINARFPVWFDSVSLIIQAVEIVLLAGFTIWLFSESAFKLDLTVTLAAVALSGPTFEFYDNILYSWVRIWRRKRLTKSQQEVLTPQSEDIS